MSPSAHPLTVHPLKRVLDAGDKIQHLAVGSFFRGMQGFDIIDNVEPITSLKRLEIATPHRRELDAARAAGAGRQTG